ncbi:aminotransferase class IV [Dongia sedimenti]|uniref:Probable branched-chain-amino-acid aminotransferase n=1 Tax=Dongia sedimenti TaxID=3064282 RepID=A0ABU0YPH4_9PROT|nr:aminotransferase class IV [Rhodospirillaceae bacterium R-7]
MIYLNGAIVPHDFARIDPADRGFTLADGLFETLRAYRGKPFRLADHLERLSDSADALGIPLLFDVPAIAEAVIAVLEANRLADAAIRITLTRGTGPRGLAPPADVKPTLLIAATPYTPLPDICAAVTVGIRRNEGSPLSRMKSLAYLDNVLAAGEAAQRHAEEAILLNNAGRVCGAARANLFAVIAGRLVTPPVSDGVLAGIARRVVLELAAVLKIPAEEASLSPADLAGAQEIFLTNSLFEIRSVARLDDRAFGPGAVAAKLRADYRGLV